MESTEETESVAEVLTARELRRRMTLKGVRIGDLAHEADVYPSALSAILSGQLPIGEQRRERIERAIIALGLDRIVEPPLAPPRDEPVFRIHSQETAE